MPQITLLHASEDTALAEQLERQLLHANNRVTVAHNNNAMYGKNINEEWTKTLYTSHLFIVLISADLSSSERSMQYVRDAVHAEPDRIIPVLIRPCLLDDGHTFNGYKVIPNKAITNYSGAAKEEIWLQIVRFILDKLSDVSEPTGYHAPMQQPWQQPTPPTRKFVRQREVVQPRPTFVETPVVPVIESRPVELQEKRAMDVVVLSAPQDRAWLPYVDRTFKVMGRGLNTTFTIHHNPEQAVDAVLDAALTLVLVSPDFLASDYNDLYHEIAPALNKRGKSIVPVLLRDCKWEANTAIIPRNGAIRKTGNDAAWSEVSREIRQVVKERSK